MAKIEIKKVSDGRAVEAEIRTRGASIYLGGRRIGDISSNQIINLNEGDFSHGIVCAGITIGCNREQADILKAAMKAAEDADPEERMRKMIERRRDIIAQINGARAEAEAEKNAAMMSGDPMAIQAAMADKSHEARAQEARRALNAFDAEHPEVKAEIEARKAADQERFTENWN